MTLFKQIIITVLFFCSTISVFSQQQQAVHFANGNFIPSGKVLRNQFKPADINTALIAGNYYVLVQFGSLPPAALQEKLLGAGMQLGSYLPGKAYLARIAANFNFSRTREFNITSIDTLPTVYKIHQKLRQYKPGFDKENTQAIAVSIFDGLQQELVYAELKTAGAIILSSRFETGGIILVQYDPAIVSPLAAIPFVSNVSLQSLVDKPLNYKSRGAHAASGLNSISGRNLNGQGVAVGIGDNADVSTHLDFSGRLINRSPATAQNHGTHTAGSTAGAGIINPVNRGMAARARVINQYFSDIIVFAPSYVTDYNMVLTNNSYHSAENGCPGEGEYNVLSNYADRQTKDNGRLLHVFASGNDGTSTCTPFPTSFATVKSGWQTAKNVLTVGALRIDNYSIASFSGRGPVSDGRLKPEIAANGVEVLSTNANNTYGMNNGTSMACPQVTGALVLMYERYRQVNGGADPKSALMKAIVCNTADDLGNVGPDFSFGFGMLNARRAIESIENSRFVIGNIANGSTINHQVTVPANTRRVKVMLYWADAPAASNASTTLVNDLDLVVTEPSLLAHRPMVLNAEPGAVNIPATEGEDHLNNIEQVTIENPAAGVYSVNISGYNIPAGTQEYILTYEFIQNGITVEYPAGGETLVPGEPEVIRWNGFGNESNTFTIQYSVNNGTDWTNIDNSVPGNRRSYLWTVPSIATNTALVRVLRNGTAVSNQSSVFTLLGQPQITATSVCQGSVQLEWGSVAGATSYDILQLLGDSMSIVANTTSLSYLVNGLDKNKTYWFGVAAKNSTNTGRRSISVSILPSTGPCTLAAFADDLKVDSILEPITARQFFANAARATSPVKISIKNNSAATIAGPFDVTFSFGGTPVTETVNTSIAANSSYTHTFSGTYPAPATGFRYNFIAWVTKAGDNNHLNDTAYKTVHYINNEPIVNLPLTEDFESMPEVEIQSAEMAVGGNKHLDFSSNRTRGRLRTFVNTGFSYSGNRALTLDQTPYNANSTIDSAIFNYNLSAFANKQLRFDFYYKNHGQANLAGNRVWIRGSENNAWVQAYHLFDNQAEVGDWKKALINISEVLASAVPAQTITPTFQVRLGQQGNFSANSPYPVVDIDDGYTFDNLVITEALNDVAAISLNSPGKTGCGLTASTPISIKLKNYNNAVLNNVQVSYQINGGPVVTENIAALAANQTLDYVFNQAADMAAYIDYNINVWVKYATDNYTANDSVLNYLVHGSPIINSYPYHEDFETDNGNFYSGGTNSTWQWGSPAKALINRAANGSKAWTTNLNGNYTDNETSYLITPCFNLTGLRKPVLSFSHIFDIEAGYDYTWVEYSTDGKTWIKLGNVNNGTNWYDNVSLRNWGLSDSNWHVASIDIPVINTTVKFRIVLSSDEGVTQEGVAIDNFRIHEKTIIPDSFPFPAGQVVSAPVSGNNWISFTSGDSIVGPWYILAEINAGGQNLGTVDIKGYTDTGVVIKSSNNNYYSGRNYVIKASGAVTGNLKVRLYLTDNEANALINASGCSTCALPVDAYELGVNKYHGLPAEENNLLADNLRGLYQMISPANTQIIPHGNGYYAEFTVNSLSEFWFSKGDIMPPAAGGCAGSVFTFTAGSPGTSYQWQLDTGNGYTNISNNSNYSGTNTATLKLSGLTGSFSGYRYRCVVDGTAGAANTVRFTNYWSGATSTDWFTASNWSCHSVPDANTDVVIPGGQAKYPVLTASAAVKSILIQPGVPVIINTGAVLNVVGR